MRKNSEAARLGSAPVPVKMISVLTLLVAFAGHAMRADEPAPKDDSADQGEESSQADAPLFEVISLEGQVVWFADALQQQLGVQLVPSARESLLALRTARGEILPLIEDLRGHSFRVDPRLRQMRVELLVRRYQATPAVQILRIYEVTEEGKWQVDYWCDICSIAMYEAGPCSCCQQENRLRKRKVQD